MTTEREQQLADLLIEQLESDSPQANTPDIQLSELLRESAAIDLPAANPELPELIEAELQTVNGFDGSPATARTNWMAWVVAASLMVIIGWLSFDRWSPAMVALVPQEEVTDLDVPGEIATDDSDKASEAAVESRNMEQPRSSLEERSDAPIDPDVAVLDELPGDDLMALDFEETGKNIKKLEQQIQLEQNRSQADDSKLKVELRQGVPGSQIAPSQGQLAVSSGSGSGQKQSDGLYFLGVAGQSGQTSGQTGTQLGRVAVNDGKVRNSARNVDDWFTPAAPGGRSGEGGTGAGGIGGGGFGGGGLGGGGGGIGGLGGRGIELGENIEGRGRFPNADSWRFEKERRRHNPGLRLNEQYERLPENDFQSTTGASAVSTFSIDVDTASYANIRRFINDGQLPPPSAVRIEEMLNYFSYHDPAPVGDKPFAVNLELADCPWNSQHQLLRVGLKGKEIDTGNRLSQQLKNKLNTVDDLTKQINTELQETLQTLGEDHPKTKNLRQQLEAAMQRKTDLQNRQTELGEAQLDQRPPVNVVLLIDVSGSMNSPDKLPLLKQGFQQLIQQLGEQDRVTIVTYAGQAGVALAPTAGDQQAKIAQAIDRLTPGGSTHGSAGIELAYELAQQNFMLEGVNKVILATDGDLNVGVTADDALVKLIQQKSSEGVFLTVLGFGTGNLKDAKMEKLADHGNGIYAYIDSARESHKVLVEQMAGSLITIAKDVKLQIEFNPAEVAAYRLIGYENRMLATEDFDNDTKDAGEIGAGHSVTALYELVPAAAAKSVLPAKGLKYQQETVGATRQASDEGLTDAAQSGEMLTLAIRYKEPEANSSQRLEFTLTNDPTEFQSASDDLRFAAGVAAFGMQLRDSQHAGESNLEMIQQIVASSLGDDEGGYRSELLDLIRKARNLK